MKKKLMVTFDEAFTKSEEVRKKLTNELINQIKKKGYKPLKVERLRLFYPFEALDILKRTFGIKKIYEIIEFENLDELKEFLKNLQIEGTFKFIVKRIDKNFPKTSIEIAKELGQFYENLGFKVDLKNPENTFIVEIHKDKIIFSQKQHEGLGGLPVGSQGKSLFLFSGGIDSPVAAFLLAKRGIKPILLFFSNGNPIVEFKALLVYKKLIEFFDTELYFYREDLSEKVKEIKRGYKQIAFKYIMYKLAEKIADNLNLISFGTGEVLSQVSTQTLKSLYLLDKSVSKLVLRPLLSFDKNEIKEIARKIGTLKYSELIDEICTVEKHSIPWPNEKVFSEEIKKLVFEFNKEKLVKVNEKIEKELTKKIEEFETMKSNNTSIEKLEDKPVIYCKTGARAWKVAKEKGFKFACSEKDLKINFLELIKEINLKI